jgi:flagellar biosynthesis component FlhA
LPELSISFALLAVAPNVVIIAMTSLSWLLLSLYEAVEYDKESQAQVSHEKVHNRATKNASSQQWQQATVGKVVVSAIHCCCLFSVWLFCAFFLL